MEIILIAIIIVMLILLFIKVNLLNDNIDLLTTKSECLEEYLIDIKTNLDNIAANIAELRKLSDSISNNIITEFNILNESKDKDVISVLDAVKVYKESSHNDNVAVYNKLDNAIKMFDKMTQSKASKAKTSKTTKEKKESENQPKTSN